MSSEWRTVRLGDLINIKHGYAFKGEFFCDSPASYQLVTPGNFAIGGGFQTTKNKYYNGPIPDDYILKPGDLIVTMTDLSKAGDTLGYGALVPCTQGTTWLHNQRVGLVEPKIDAAIYIPFVHYLLRSSKYRHWVISSATGSTVKHTSPGRIGDFNFLLPPINEQKHIAVTLGALDDRITQLRETSKTLESIAQAIFKSWFVDFDPVHAKEKGIAPEGMDEATATLFPDSFEETELGMVPKGWEIKTIGDVIETVGGGTPATKNETFWSPAEFNWTTPKDLSGSTTPILIESERKISALGVSKISSGLLPVGTLLMSSRAPIGYLAVAQIKIAINQGYIAMLPGGILPPLYMLLWCQLNMDAIKDRGNGSTFMEISKKAFRPMHILVPPQKLIISFVDLFNSLFERMVINEKKTLNLTNLRDTLLPCLISGQLRIEEAQEMVESV